MSDLNERQTEVLALLTSEFQTQAALDTRLAAVTGIEDGRARSIGTTLSALETRGLAEWHVGHGWRKVAGGHHAS